MTSITLTATGAKLTASVNGPLTAGMVGIPVTIEYDDAWLGLSKNLICRCDGWGPDKGFSRAVMAVENTATVAHEVMVAGKYLYLGIEGCHPDGTLVVPTTWAKCGIIQAGADTGADPTADPTLPIWHQLHAEIMQIRQFALMPEQLADVQAYAQEAKAAAMKAEAALQKVETPILNETARTTLITILRNGMYGSDQAENITVLDTALALPDNGSGGDIGSDDEPEADLTGISAVYHGSDVPVDIPVSTLTGVAVTAHYSDGTSKTVTGFTLSGTIEEGSNTITVTYRSKTAKITVNGVIENAGPTETLLYNWDFTTSLTDTTAGNTAVLNGEGVTQDSNGLTINRIDATPTYVSFSTNIHGKNRRYELDIAELSNSSNTNAYLFHCDTLAGLFYFSMKWQLYTSTNWEWIDTGLTDIGAFSGKTLSIVIGGDYTWEVYLDGELLVQSSSAVSKNGQTLTIGSTATNAGCENIRITGMRVYDIGGV